MIYIFREAVSEGVDQLAAALDNKRIRYEINARRLVALPNHRVVAWGQALPRALNGAPIKSKYSDAVQLRKKGVNTIEVSRTRPVARPAVPVKENRPNPQPDPAIELFRQSRELAMEFAALRDFPGRGQVFIRGTGELGDAITALRRALLDEYHPMVKIELPPGPAEPLGEWLGRSNNHVGGIDLMRGNGTDYFAKKENLVAEFRVHSFKGRSIRAGKKIPREGFNNPHNWIRSWDGGWRISYDGESVKQKHRDIAHAAIEALGLDFGAVDIGQKADGSVLVLEVNRAPGLEGGTVMVYAEAIRQWSLEAR